MTERLLQLKEVEAQASELSQRILAMLLLALNAGVLATLN
jgi:hypothetical protein